MPEPQGLIQFPGIGRILSASMTFSHGISPSSAVVQLVPEGELTVEPGLLSFTYGQTRIDFPDARVDTGSVQSSGSGQTLSVRIQDRRWRWEFGDVVGRYNVRSKDDEYQIEEGTEKSPRELATLLLDAMGEAGFGVDSLPDDTRPEVSWVWANPAAELASLCGSLGCRVVLGLDNRVRIHRVGIGVNLPDLPSQSGLSIGIDATVKPDSIKVICGPTRYQSQFVTEGVGQDLDGRVLPIDLLSYTPDTGWASQDIERAADDVEVDANARGLNGLKALNLAMSTVYRWYRVSGGVGGLLAPGYDGPGGPITDVDQCLPLADELVDKAVVSGRKARNKAAVVSGSWYANDSDLANRPNSGSSESTHSLDGERGIVQMPQATYEAVNDGQGQAPAVIGFECSYGVRQNETGILDRFVLEEDVPGRANGTGAKIIHRDELVLTRVARYDAEGVLVAIEETNRAEIEDECRHSIAAALRDFGSPVTGERSYAELVKINVDGAIQQLSWSVGLAGAVTRISRNTEHNLAQPNYAERQRAKMAAAPKPESKAAKVV